MPDDMFDRFLEEGGEDILPDAPATEEAVGRAEATPQRETGAGTLQDILGVLTSIAGIGLPVRGAVVTKAIGSKL